MIACAPSALSVDEKVAFDKLKKRIVDEFGPSAADDDRIERFLKARDCNVQQAYSMLKNNVELRRKWKVDTMFQGYVTPEVFEKYLPFNIIGFDKGESLVVLASIGRFDYKGFLKSAKKEEIMKQLLYFAELSEQVMRDRSKELGRPVKQWTAIVDFENISLGHVTSKPTIERNIEEIIMYEAHYPEMLKTVYAINIAPFFLPFFNIIKPLITSKTLQKIKIFGKEGWKEELTKIIDPKLLPAYLGGEKRDPDGNPMCYSTLCQGGVIPKEFYMQNRDVRQLRNEPGVKSHVLKRRSKLNLPFDVKTAGSFIEWDIETDNYDIGFGISFEETKAKDVKRLLPLIPVQRVDAHVFSETGSYLCEKSGTYILTLDNSYSKIRPKHIYYRLAVVKPEEKKMETIY